MTSEMMLAGLGNDDCLLSVHAATLFAQLSNIAEDQHVKRLARADLLAGAGDPDGGIEAALGRLASRRRRQPRGGVDAGLGACRTGAHRPPDRGAAQEHPRPPARDRRAASPNGIARSSPPADAARSDEALRRAHSHDMAHAAAAAGSAITVIDEIDNGLDYSSGHVPRSSCRA